MMLPYLTYRSVLKKTFKTRVLKVPLNGGFSCPNKKNGNACTFCDNRSFSPAALRAGEVKDQFCAIRDRRKDRYSAFIPYLQPNTNTYAPVEDLRLMYDPLIKLDGVVGLAIGTRPDCLDDDVVGYLAELNKKTYLSLEIGLQSSSNKTLKHISRGHTFEEFAEAVERVAKHNIEVVVHIMAGLPGEAVDDMVQTVKDISKLPIQGVKIHQLMVIRDTEMADEYNNGEFDTLSIEKYAPVLTEMLRHLRADISVHRIMADTKDGYGLISPLWSLEKDQSIMFLQKFLVDSGIEQGELFKSDSISQ
jgi:radical SAM protein (TIGR01212 family)